MARRSKAEGSAPAVVNETKFYLSAMLKIGDEKVPIVVQSGDEILIQLTKPAKLGNALTVGAWLHSAWKTDVGVLLVTKNDKKEYTPENLIKPNEVEDDKLSKHLQEFSIPASMTTQLAKLIKTDVWITDLYYRAWAVDDKDKEIPRNKATPEQRRTAIKMGIKLDFTAGEVENNGLSLIAEISLLDVGLGFTHAPPNYVFPKHTELPAIASVSEEELKKLQKGADLEEVSA